MDSPILRTVCGPHALGAVADAVKAAWAMNSWVPEKTRLQVETAVAEIAANIVEHANTTLHAATVEMRMRILPDHVEVAFADSGAEVDVDLDAVEMPDEFADRGRGLAIAKALLAHLAYRRSETGNHWTLISRAFGPVKQA